MLAIPKPIMSALELRPDAAVGLSVQSGRLIVEPTARRRYSLDQLLAESRRTARRSRGDREWVTGREAGRELI
jgi:antitoxin ChpS